MERIDNIVQSATFLTFKTLIHLQGNTERADRNMGEGLFLAYHGLSTGRFKRSLHFGICKSRLSLPFLY